MISYSISSHHTKTGLSQKRLTIECDALVKCENNIYTLCKTALEDCKHLKVEFVKGNAVDLSFVNTLCTIHMLALLNNKQLTVNGLTPDMFKGVSEHIRNTRAAGCLVSMGISCFLADLCSNKPNNAHGVSSSSANVNDR